MLQQAVQVLVVRLVVGAQQRLLPLVMVRLLHFELPRLRSKQEPKLLIKLLYDLPVKSPKMQFQS